jgi:hypothetical protein
MKLCEATDTRRGLVTTDTDQLHPLVLPQPSQT